MCGKHKKRFFPKINSGKMQSTVEAFETEGYGATTPEGAVARNRRGAAALKLAVLSLAVVAVLAISGVFSSSNQVPALAF